MADCLADDNLGNEVIEISNEETIDIDEAVFSSQPLIALQPLSEQENDDVKIEITEEVLDESYVDVPHIGQEQEISSAPAPASPKQANNKKRKPKASRSRHNKKVKNVSNANKEYEGTNDIDVPRKWERKKVQIKTLEGEFSVTMWASGRINGKTTRYENFFLYVLFCCEIMSLIIKNWEIC